MRNMLSKSVCAAVLLALSATASAADLLDRGARYNWPGDLKTTGEIIRYLIEPYQYTFVVNNPTAKRIDAGFPVVARDPVKIGTIKALLLDLADSDVFLVIDNKRRRITYAPMVATEGRKP